MPIGARLAVLLLFLDPFALAPVVTGFSVATLSLAELAEPSLLAFEAVATLPLGFGFLWLSSAWSTRGLVVASEEEAGAGIGLTTGLPLLSWLNLLIKSSAAAAVRGGFLPVLGFPVLTITWHIECASKLSTLVCKCVIAASYLRCYHLTAPWYPRSALSQRTPASRRSVHLSCHLQRWWVYF